ncbi:MAG: acylphosphatase [Syntrophus sp. (in: bacteria)]|nr:acylphosphatase [Syntrophus sp. (in: bacteria)]
MKRMYIVVKGIVQGVSYRYNTEKKANEYQLTGWVKNASDGNVEILCEGREDSINQFIEWCKVGPRGAHVEEVHTEWGEYTGEFRAFEIRY